MTLVVSPGKIAEWPGRGIAADTPSLLDTVEVRSSSLLVPTSFSKDLRQILS
jgi:hypothetical protein